MTLSLEAVKTDPETDIVTVGVLFGQTDDEDEEIVRRVGNVRFASEEWHTLTLTGQVKVFIK